MQRFLSLALVWIPLGVAACGGSTDVLLGSTSSSGGGGDSAASSTSDGGSTDAATTATAGSGGAGTTTTATTGTTGAGGAPGTTTVTSSSEASTTATTSGGGTPDPIPCGDTTCDPATQQCCATFNGTSCVDIGDCQQGLPISCTSAANCTDGDVCCFLGGPGQPPETVCAPECQGGGGPGGGNGQLCASDAECPDGLTCQPSFDGNFMFCRP